MHAFMFPTYISLIKHATEHELSVLLKSTDDMYFYEGIWCIVMLLFVP